MEITVKRFDPSKDDKPYDQTFEVPYKEHITALEALMYIYEHDAPIAFDYSCHGRSCGRCSMMVDGEAKLACIAPLSDGAHVIEPLVNYPVIRDLIVDKTKEQETAARLYARIQTDELTDDEVNNTYDMEAQPHLFDIEWCARCGRCTAVCPAKKSSPLYVGPMAMLGTAFRYYDPYDQGDRVVEAVQNGLYDCIMCGKCTEVCDSHEIEHLVYWQALRNAAEQRGLKPNTAK